MNKKAKEPFLAARIVSLLLGIAALIMAAAVLIMDGGTELYEILIFALAAIINFISSIICFIQQRMFRGNLYAIICAVFLNVAVFLAVRYFIFV